MVYSLLVHNNISLEHFDPFCEGVMKDSACSGSPQTSASVLLVTTTKLGPFCIKIVTDFTDQKIAR